MKSCTTILMLLITNEKALQNNPSREHKTFYRDLKSVSLMSLLNKIWINKQMFDWTINEWSSNVSRQSINVEKRSMKHKAAELYGKACRKAKFHNGNFMIWIREIKMRAFVQTIWSPGFNLRCVNRCSIVQLMYSQFRTLMKQAENAKRDLNRLIQIYVSKRSSQ